MTRLTTDDASLIFLALEEYASGYSLTLSADAHAQVRDLAARVGGAKALHLDE